MQRLDLAAAHRAVFDTVLHAQVLVIAAYERHGRLVHAVAEGLNDDGLRRLHCAILGCEHP